MMVTEWKKIISNTTIITHSDFLKLKKRQVLNMLIQSLEKDGRYYGAEMQEELDYWLDYCCSTVNSYPVEYV